MNATKSASACIDRHQLTETGPDPIAEDVNGRERIGARGLHLQDGMTEEDYEDEQTFDGIRLLPAQVIIIKACAIETHSQKQGREYGQIKKQHRSVPISFPRWNE